MHWQVGSLPLAPPLLTSKYTSPAHTWCLLFPLHISCSLHTSAHMPSHHFGPTVSWVKCSVAIVLHFLCKWQTQENQTRVHLVKNSLDWPSHSTLDTSGWAPAQKMREAFSSQIKWLHRKDQQTVDLELPIKTATGYLIKTCEPISPPRLPMRNIQN